MINSIPVNMVKSALASGTSLAALTVAPASLAILTTPASAQVVCITSPLNVLDCTPANSTAPVVLTGQTQPVTITLPDVYNDATTLEVASTGPIDLTSSGVASVATATGPALDLTSGADINARITTLSTAGDGAAGAVLLAADDAILIVDDTVTTTGNGADGINVTAGSAAVTLGDTRTAGVDSDGVEIVTLSGPGTINANLIETLASGSTDAIARSAGDINLNAGVLRSGGDQALGFDLQSQPGACAVLGAGSCDVNAVVGNITTDGFGSIGGLVVAAGRTDVALDTLQTGGDEAAGLDLSADPTACTAIGTGGCGTAFTVNNLTTNGARSPGAVVRAVGDIDGNVGVLTTGGQDSAGLDLASDPAACVILGAGSCGTSFSVGQLTTNGAGSTGALVRAAGPTTASFGTIDTFGDGARGVDIASDPTACLTLGVGQCDTTLTAQRISTAGDLAGGALVNSPARIVADLGLVSTDGTGSPALTLITDPAACAVLGTGGCGVIVGNGGSAGGGALGAPTGGTPGAPGGTDIDTDGDDSPGAVIATPGPVDADFGSVDTDGNNSPGVVVAGGEGPIDIDFDSIDTKGDNSPGLLVRGTGPINIGGGTVATAGLTSPGIAVAGDDGPVTLDVGQIVTTGPGSDGIEIATGTGGQTILAGPITVSGLGSNGIAANAAGCGAVDVTARAAITSASGVGINAASACTVAVRTLLSAPVRGAAAGINVVSGSGADVILGDMLSSTGGPALNIDGAPATVLIQESGTLDGAFDLTDTSDTLINAGTLDTFGTSSFGAGTDSLVNSGRLLARRGVAAFGGLENIANSGLIDLRDGATDDVLTLSGSYVGMGAARLGVDLGSGTASDRLVIGGAATGSTQLLVAGSGQFANAAIVVDAGAGTAPSAFILAASTRGFVDYSLAFDPAANDFSLFGTPSSSAFAAGLLASGARELFYGGSEAVAAQLDGGFGTGEGQQERVSHALWAQAYGMAQDRDLSLDAAPFGQARSYDLSGNQDWWGVQAGYDFAHGTSSVIGITAGYAQSGLRFERNPVELDYETLNIGVYSRLAMGPLVLRGLAKYQWFWADVEDQTGGFTTSPSGNGWGGWLEAAYRFGEKVFAEPSVSVDYADIHFDDFAGLGTQFVADEQNGLRGKAGIRVGALLNEGVDRSEAYAKIQVVHEFDGEDTLTLSNSGLTFATDLPRIDTYGRATLGLDANLSPSLNGFAEGSADFAGGVRGLGGRVGLSLKF